MTKTTTWRVLAAAAATTLLLSACGTTGGDGGDAGGSADAGGSCDLAIGYMGALTGDAANLGTNMLNGVKLAVDEHNKESDCKVEIVQFDSQGLPDVATPLAAEAINNEKVVGLVGPSFSGETDATGAAFAEAGLVTVSPSATNPKLSTNGWDTFHRVLGNDSVQGPQAAAYITGTGAEKVFVVDDASDYGKGIAENVAATLGDAVVETDTIQQKQTDFGPTVTKVLAADADALFFGGYYAEGGLLMKQLRAGGWEGTFVSGDGSLDAGFVEAAGADAAEGAVLTCPCAPSPEDFTAAFKALNGVDPGTYSAEAYDATNVLLDGIDAGSTDRAKLLEFVNAYDEEGITKQVKFDETGEVAEVVVYAYTVKDGKIQPGEPIE
ncbi:branched-chain amino acid ABC transporter substrate-binding protein [Ornithinimicrobium tianjinense]|uniref:ABC transporter/extracellular ligand-binding receptor n=1 Tax=Ornithinimicrobium tianjinense TaxID=1195761 RepID=A0A917BFI6_9MICO|nr:branched-chain amino acid ABC transporter substrate-binding protein [Ornithinimicrobium tianjinense]GGF41607.1 putative ABC transporter/extracellular ligand-binding receptor [Ornithinimicrobium tianjinense]